MKNELKNDSRYSAFAPLQLANARSNTALLKLASGGSFQEARATWEQGADTGHTESQFYPALVAEKQGHPKEADEIVRALTTAAWFDARETLNEGILEGGWFKEWCAAGLIVLERNAPEVSVLAIPELNVQSLMDLPCVSTENLKDGIDFAGRKNLPHAGSNRENDSAKRMLGQLHMKGFRRRNERDFCRSWKNDPNKIELGLH